MLGTIFRSPEYVIDGATWNSDINTFVGGVALDPIDMSGVANIVEAADAIQAWATAEGYTLSTDFSGTTLTITSTEVIFIDNADAETFSNEKLITVEDQTAWVSPDGLSSSSFTVKDAASGATLGTYSELPNMSDLTESTTGNYFVDGEAVSNLGCTFVLDQVDAGSFANGDYFINFQLINA